MWPDVEEQVAVEQAQIDGLIDAYQVAIKKASQQEPDFIELSALATMLHAAKSVGCRVSYLATRATFSGKTSPCRFCA